MATYTDNYQLTKPTYAEQADIGVLNSNMNKIDEVMHSSQISLADAYDQSQTYAEGDKVMYELLMYKCIAPTTGVWDASKWERTTASESGGGGSAELDILGEASGAVASFADGASAGLAKCIAEIVPKQDLHGYSKPWAGGAGKNILPLVLSDIKSLNTAGTWNGNIYSYNGIDFEIITDSNENVTGIRLNGTSSSSNQPVLRLMNKTFNATNYIINGIPTGASDNTYFLNLTYSDGTNVNYSTTTTMIKTFNITAGLIYVRRSQTLNNIEFNPMISSSGGDFEPYSNICPISGHSSVAVTISDGETSTTKTTALGQTVYGGQLNVLTGELTIDREFITFDGSENWQVNAGQNGYTIYNVLPTAITRGNGISNEFYVQTSYYTQMSLILGQNNRNIYAIQINNNISGVTDLASWKSWLSNNNCQICFEVAPQTVQLTPQEVNSLLGQNNISADTGDVDIVYVKASAPIQPNPTGTPTATLTKLGIEGTVFEVPSGGGGSSETVIDDTERVIGTYFGKTLYQRVITPIITSNTTLAGDLKYGSFALGDYISSVDMAFVDLSASYIEPATGATRGLVSAYYEKDSGNMTILTMFARTNSPSSLCIKYTKITD